MPLYKSRAVFQFKYALSRIDAGKIVGKIISFDGVADDADEYLGMKENDWIAFEERHVWEFSRNLKL